MLEDMKKAYEAASGGTDTPDIIMWYGYENYVKACQFWGIKPIPERELEHE